MRYNTSAIQTALNVHHRSYFTPPLIIKHEIYKTNAYQLRFHSTNRNVNEKARPFRLVHIVVRTIVQRTVSEGGRRGSSGGDLLRRRGLLLGPHDVRQLRRCGVRHNLRRFELAWGHTARNRTSPDAGITQTRLSGMLHGSSVHEECMMVIQTGCMLKLAREM